MSPVKVDKEVIRTMVAIFCSSHRFKCSGCEMTVSRQQEVDTETQTIAFRGEVPLYTYGAMEVFQFSTTSLFLIVKEHFIQIHLK